MDLFNPPQINLFLQLRDYITVLACNTTTVICTFHKPHVHQLAFPFPSSLTSSLHSWLTGVQQKLNPIPVQSPAFLSICTNTSVNTTNSHSMEISFVKVKCPNCNKAKTSCHAEHSVLLPLFKKKKGTCTLQTVSELIYHNILLRSAQSSVLESQRYCCSGGSFGLWPVIRE